MSNLNINISHLNVFYHGNQVGTLIWNKEQNLAQFAYHLEFVKSGIELSPILMPLSDKIYSFPHYSFDTFQGLPPLFSDSLPDDFGNRLMHKFLLQNKIKSIRFLD
jgi:serine/threonine-protein kinase HipA